MTETVLIPEPKQWSLNPDCLHYNIKTHSEAWHAFRSRGFGASEIGVVTGSSDWMVLPQLIEAKAGLRSESILNEAMLAGLLAENGIITRWKYFDGNGKNYVQNYANKMIKRECVGFSGYMVNKKYPKLFCSTDAWAMPNSVNLITSEIMSKGFPIEAKVISGFHTDKWISGVPPQYIFQGNQEMMIFGVDYCEFAILKNGTDFEVIPMELSPRIVEIILQKSEEAWSQVESVRALVAAKERAPYAEKEHIQSEIDSILPLPDENPLYKKFYSEKFEKKKELEFMPKDVLDWAHKRVRLTAAAKEIDKEITAFENYIRREFSLKGTEYMDAGSDGKLRYYIKGSTGKSHTLDFAGFKAKPKGELLAEIERKTQELIKNII